LGFARRTIARATKPSDARPSKDDKMKYLWSICAMLLSVLSVVIGMLLPALAMVIYLGSVLFSLNTNIPTLLFTAFLPVIAQAYWISQLWAATGTLFHPLTLLCAAWLALLGIRIFAQNMLASWRPPQSS
jgi:hypothetical protein